MARKLKCPNCDNSMVYVSETKRANSICRAHFRHNGEPCPNDEYEKAVSVYRQAKELEKYKKFLQCPTVLGDKESPTAIAHLIGDVIEAMVKVKPSIETRCCMCGVCKKTDLSSGSWEMRPNSILVHLKYSQYLTIEFENAHASVSSGKRSAYRMIVDPFNPLVSLSDNLFPCRTCTARVDTIVNKEMELRKEIKSESSESFKSVTKQFVEKIDHTTYFTTGKYTARKISEVWEEDKVYFYTSSDAYEQTEAWFSQKFGADKIIIDLIGNQLRTYYDNALTERSCKHDTATALEMRDDRLGSTLGVLNRMAVLEERFEDFLTCQLPKYKGLSYYVISKRYLSWLIDEVSIFQKMSIPQQFFVLDAYLS